MQCKTFVTWIVINVLIESCQQAYSSSVGTDLSQLFFQHRYNHVQNLRWESSDRYQRERNWWFILQGILWDINEDCIFAAVLHCYPLFDANTLISPPTLLFKFISNFLFRPQRLLMIVQYGRIKDIDLKTPNRPPAFAFVAFEDSRGEKLSVEFILHVRRLYIS